VVTTRPHSGLNWTGMLLGFKGLTGALEAVYDVVATKLVETKVQGLNSRWITSRLDAGVHV
jgi:hypothetical protein